MFSISGRDVHCADFSEDVTIKKQNPDEEQAGGEEPEGS
jgi:hypothetical protein